MLFAVPAGIAVILHRYIAKQVGPHRHTPVWLASWLQVLFAVIAPGQVIPNLVAGAVAEAGAQQAGDMMQASSPILYFG